MLPDFIALKRRVEKKLTANMRVRARSGVLSLVSHIHQHEGEGFVLYRDDGSIQESGFRRHTAEVALSVDDIRKRGMTAVHEATTSLAEQMNKSGSEHLFEAISAATRGAGTEVSAGGKPFTAELYLDGLEKMQLGFDTTGNWQQPTIVVHPTQTQRLVRQLERLDLEPALKARLEGIVNRKREEWRDREAHRKLVD